jgi:tRNA-dihydrouridine synthase 1
MPTPSTPSSSLSGVDFHKSLSSPKYLVAPMVEQSEYAWRILSLRHGAQLVYTPMFHARIFATEEKYRNSMFTTGEEERGKVIVQFCANDPEHLLAGGSFLINILAAKKVESRCVAIDLNLGCPQNIAKRGNYGSFLMNDLDLVRDMVLKLSTSLSIPITCKIRVFPTVKESVQYALMLQDAGCKMLTVHGRLREQRGHNTGIFLSKLTN